MDSSLERLVNDARRELMTAGWKDRITRLVAGPHGMHLNLEIHSRDQMLTHSLANHGRVDAALSQYIAISIQQLCVLRQIIEARFGSRLAMIEALDFACGYGRLLRLLPTLIPASRTWASEIQPDALAFVAETFGVHTVASHAEPDQFNPGRTFDLIWVASLFSHLPERLFIGWLRRLTETLAPAGLLCFSVRDVSQLPAGTALPDGGVRYVEQSENSGLHTDIYGTTYASETFVAEVLERVAPGLPWARIPRALANEQDLYVLANEREADLGFVQRVRRGPWGWVDIQRHSGAELELQGWATSLDDGEVAHVDVQINGTTERVTTGVSRPDVAEVLGDPRTSHAGWTYRTRVGVEKVDIEICAVDRSGQLGLLLAGSIDPIQQASVD